MTKDKTQQRSKPRIDQKLTKIKLRQGQKQDNDKAKTKTKTGIKVRHKKWTKMKTEGKD